MSAERRGDFLAVALLLLLPTLLFGEVLAGRSNFALRDLTRYYYPTKQIYGRIVAGGELPLWNRYFHAGQPLAANPEHEIFYPPTWLLLLPDFDLGYRLHILFHIYAALLTMYAFLRSLPIRAPAATFGAVSWGVGGLILSYINLLPILFCATWLPLTCLFAIRFLNERRWRDFALASLSFGVQCLVAEPTTLLQTGVILGALAIDRGVRSARPLTRVTANVGWVALMSAAAIAVGAVQMLPAIDHAGDSTRARGFPFDLVEAWSMPWAKLSELVYPNVLGHVQHGGEIVYWGGRLYEPMGAPFLLSIYPGLAVMALFAAGVAVRLRGATLALALVAGSIVVALGGNLPLLRFLYDAGIASSVRYPEKFVLIAVFAIVVFAASACQRLLDGDERVRRTAIAFALASAVVAGGISMAWVVPSAIAEWMLFFALRPEPENLRLAGIAWIDWNVAVARGLILFLILLLMRSPRPRIWLAIGFAFVCADLGLVVRELNPTLPRRYFTAAPAIVAETTGQRAGNRLFHLADWQIGDEIGQRFPEKDARYWAVRNGLFPTMPAAYEIPTVLERDYDATALLPTVDLTRSMWEVRRSGRRDWLEPFLAMSNVGMVALEQNQPDRAASNLEEVRPVRIVHTRPYPRYYFADQVVAISGRRDFVARLASGDFSHRAAFIRAPAFQPAPGRVLGVRETANTATIDVEAGGRALLVMSVTPHKYWRVTIDGRPVQPLVVNIGYQGVIVPEGRHRIEMQYRNAMVTAGVASTLISTMLFAFIAVRGRRGVDA